MKEKHPMMVKPALTLEEKKRKLDEMIARPTNKPIKAWLVLQKKILEESKPC